MGKKHALAGAVAALFMIPYLAHAPSRKVEYFHPPKEKVMASESLLEKMSRENEERIENLIEEKNWMETDTIYRKITSASGKLDVPKYITRKFIRCLGGVESSDRPYVKSEKGAMGWGQLMKAAWYDVEQSDYEKNVSILDKNIEVTIKYLSFLNDKLGESHPQWSSLDDKEKVRLIAAAYNGGFGNLRNSGWDVQKMKKETKEYMPKIERMAKVIAPLVRLYY